MKNDPALSTHIDALRRTIKEQKVDLASRKLRITGLEEMLKECERFMSYFANETDGHFVGDGTPTTCLARIRHMLGAPRLPCECGFTPEECAPNPCLRKKVHLAGLTPGSKWPKGAPCCPQGSEAQS